MDGEGLGRKWECGKGCGKEGKEGSVEVGGEDEGKERGVRGGGTYGSSAFSKMCSLSVPSIRALSRLFKDPSP